ncbi:MAG TPA: hypothetical protein VFU88_05565 [Ktedonobacterales bacterium]|nr:hypothetical protein [Ktedonobacterales bacterium]
MSANRSPAGKAQQSPRESTPRYVRLSALLALALLALALGIATGSAAAAAHPLSAQHPRLAPPAGTITPTATATATPPSSGTITLVSPSYGKGPAGAHVTVSGSGFTGSSVSLFASSHAACSDTKASLGLYPLSGGAFANQTFVWPALAPGTYYICAPGLSGGAPSYQQLSASPPSISLSAPRVPAGSSLTISGSNFAGLPAGTPIVMLAQQNSTTINLPAAVLNDNGSFTLPWMVDENLNGLVTIKALSSPEGGAPAVLQASAVVTVLPPATATPTTTTTPTATVAAGTGQTSTPRGTSSGGGGGILLLLGLLALIVLTGVGVGAFLLLRGRTGPGVQKGYPGEPGGYGGYGQTGGYPGVGPSGTAGRMSSAGYPTQFGSSGEYGSGGYGGAGVGAVSQWDDVSGEPDPGWQPRPMTGYGRFDLPPDDASTAQGWQPGDEPPDDPWAEPPYGGARGGYGGQRSGGGGQSGWGNIGADDGTGTTQPGYGGQGHGQDNPYGQPGSRGTGRYPRPDRYPDDDDAGDRGPWPDPRTGGRGGGGGGQGW